MTRAAIVASTSLLLLLGLSPALQGQEPQEGTWTGTRVRLGGRNNPNPQRISMEIAKTADPHSAWRPEKRQLLNATFIAGQGKYQVSDLRVAKEGLSFSYREEIVVTCRLEGQPDGAYQGECVGDGDGRRFRVTLNPPKASS
jgi:hypothetical protein